MAKSHLTPEKKPSSVGLSSWLSYSNMGLHLGGMVGVISNADDFLVSIFFAITGFENNGT